MEDRDSKIDSCYFRCTDPRCIAPCNRLDRINRILDYTHFAQSSNANRKLTGFKIGISAGNPVEKSDKLFGDTIQLARHLSTIAKSSQVALSSAVKELAASYNFQQDQKYLTTLSPQDEICLKNMFNTLEENWQDADFTVTEFCKGMAMSKSQLYRKTITLSGFSPNILLKEFRLDKAKELLRSKRFTISQATFDSGFTSPSYFTKCFKKKFGLLPETYLQLLQ